MEIEEVERLVHGIDREIIKRLSQRIHKDFRTELNDVLSLYLNLLGEFNIENALGEEYALIEIPVYIQRVKKWCKDIEEMVDGYFEGDLLKTIKIYKRLFQRTSRNYLLQFPLTKVKQYSLWYRSRENDKGECWDKKQLFHVSFGERHKIGSQRFSILGFPCLYLASSLECCFKEVRSNVFTTFCAFKALSDIEVYDFSFYPSIQDKKALWSYLFLYPIKIACSIPVRSECEKPNFIPEYIIPEYVLHGTIKQYRETTKSLGFIYSSVSAFSESATKEDIRKCTNLVIPTFDIKDTGYCNKLRNMFSMTEPITLSCSDIDYYLRNQVKDINGMAFEKLLDTEEPKEN